MRLTYYQGKEKEFTVVQKKQNQMNDVIKELKIVTSLWNEHYCYKEPKNWDPIPSIESYKKGCGF